MHVLIEPDYAAMSRAAALLVAAAIRAKPDIVLGLPTGATPAGMYDELVRLHRDEGLSFARVTTFNLDEYCGLGPEHPASFHRYMRERLIGRVDLDPARVHIPAGRPVGEPRTWCLNYERLIEAAGGIDLIVLGIGANGHIGFNEPGTPLESRTRVAPLTARTRADNRPAFGGAPVPDQAVTMGIATILETSHVLLLAAGAAKAEAVAAAVQGPITEEVPASALQMHTDATVLLDAAAASALRWPQRRRA